MAGGKNNLLAALDVGSTKITCFIARHEPDGYRVIGIGHQPARGMRAGTVVDVQQVDESIRAAVDQAERMAGETVQEAVVNISGGLITSTTLTVDVPIENGAVDDNDLERLQAQVRTAIGNGQRQILHCIPVSYAVDETNGIKDPRGMFGEKLSARMHVLSNASGVLKNLTGCIERCPLSVKAVSASGYVAGLSTLHEDEMELGVALIDLGGGTTSVGVYSGGALVYADSITIGGVHVTHDIARGLTTTMAYAERLKTLYGSALAGPMDDREYIDVPRVGEAGPDSTQEIPRSALLRIIEPRLEEIFELVREKLETSGYGKQAGRQAVLVGGGAQLPGLRELASRVLGRQVRIGRPSGVKDLASTTDGPAFAAAAGLLHFAGGTRICHLDPVIDARPVPNNRFARLGRWFKTNF